MGRTLALVAALTLADRLAAARAAAGHTQAECADLLTSRFGAPVRSQASISRYVSGKQQMPIDMARAVSQYIMIFEPDEAAGANDARAGSDGREEMPAQQFAGIVRRLTDEPLLGPRQGALVDAMIGRLRGGPPLSEQDAAALTAAMRILALDE